MKQKQLLYTGKAKSVYRTDVKGKLIVEFRDDITAFDGGKKDTLENKGSYNAGVSAFLFSELEKNGVKTHFQEMLDEKRMVVRELSMIPLEVIVRNVAAGSIVRNYPIKEGTPLKPPVIVIDYKDDSRHDPMLNDDLIVALKIASPAELKKIKTLALKVNAVLSGMLAKQGITLVDFKMEFGRQGKPFTSVTKSAWTLCASGTKKQGSPLTKMSTGLTRETLWQPTTGWQRGSQKSLRPKLQKRLLQHQRRQKSRSGNSLKNIPVLLRHPALKHM